MTKERYSAKGAEALFAAAFTYALTPVLIREMSPMWGDKSQVAARYSLVFIFLLAYMYFRKKSAKISPNKRLAAVILGISFALVVLFFTFSVQKTTIANSLLTFYATNMLASFLLGTFILKESVSRAKLVALAFALAGLSLYSNAIWAGNLGILFGVLAGISAGVSNLTYKWLKDVDRSAILHTQYGVGAIFTILVTLFSGDQIVRTVSLRGIITTVLFAFVLIAAANLLVYGYQHFDVNIGTIIMSMELVFGAIFGLILFQEVPESHELLGGALIFLGSVLSSIDPERFSLKQKFRLD